MNEKSKRGLEIAANVLLYIVLAVALFSVIMAIVSKKDPDGAATVFGYQMRIVQSESMAESEYTDVSDYQIKSLPLKALLVVKTVPTDPEKAEKFYASIKKGDVLTFRYVYDRQVTITHRVIEDPEKKETGGYIIRLEGDNKGSDDPAVLDTQVIDTSLGATSPNYIIGKVVSSSPLLGKFIHALTLPVTVVCVVIVPALIIIVWEVVRIVNVLGEEKRKKILEDSQKKEDEIEALKKQLAMLSQAVGVKMDEDQPTTEETDTQE
jgi:hypothetical protein